MPFEVQTIPLSAVDLADKTFRITTESSVAVLSESLRSIGLLNAPLLAARGNRFTVVSGFRRLRAALGLGWDTLAVRIATPGTAEIACARCAVADNALQRRLNLIEQSRALNLLAQFFTDTAEMAASAVSLGLPASPTVIEKLRRIEGLPPAVQKLILEEVLSLSMALALQQIPVGECMAFADLFKQLRPSLGKQRELFTLVNEIALREEKSVLTILDEAGLRRILSDDDSSRAEKTSAVRRYLKQRRFPVLSKAQKKFAEFRTGLALGARFQLIPPPDFEGAEYAIRLQFGSMAELEAHRSALAALMENAEFRKMLD